jgi:DNA modification methylase
MTTRTSPVAPQIAINYRNIHDLKPDPRNARQHSKKQIRQIAESIKIFGFNVPVLIDGHDNIVAGHGRLLACRQLGHTEVPTICLDHLSQAQIRAFAIADNRLAEVAIWDDRLLAEQLSELAKFDLDFSLEVTGFDMGDIDFRIESLTTLDPAKADPADTLPPPSAIAVSQLGDVWQAGPHRMHCANALDDAAYQRLMEGKLAGVVFADPPYNVKVTNHVCGKGAIQHREFAMASGEMSEAEFTQFLTAACALLARHSAQGAIHYVCMDWRHIKELLSAGEAAYTELKNVCIWAKDNAGMGSLYRSQHELIFVFKNGTAAHINNIELGKHGRHRTNVWRYPGANSFGRTNEECNLLAMHPTTKAVAMVADALLDCSNRGDIVLDPFLGSGTTLIAAQRTGRICYSMELDPLYVDTAIRRWKIFTGQTAIHTVTGQTFDEREAHAADIAEQLSASSRNDSKGTRHDS